MKLFLAAQRRAAVRHLFVLRTFAIPAAFFFATK